LAKALKPYLGEDRYPVRKEFRHALERIAPALPRTLGAKFKTARNLARPLKKVEEGRDVMLPMRNTPEARRFARQVRKQRSGEVHAAREDALAARKTQYDSERTGLKSQHERETKEERVERATLRAEAAAEWTSYAEEHNLPEQKKPDWMERLQEEDAALLQEVAEQKPIEPAPEKPAKAPSPTRSWRDAAEGTDWRTRQIRPRPLLPPTVGVAGIKVRKLGSI